MQVKYYCKKKKFDFRCARFVSRVNDLIIFVNIVSSVSISIVSRVLLQKKKTKQKKNIIIRNIRSEI